MLQSQMFKKLAPDLFWSQSAVFLGPVRNLSAIVLFEWAKKRQDQALLLCGWVCTGVTDYRAKCDSHAAKTDLNLAGTALHDPAADIESQPEAKEKIRKEVTK